MIKLLKQTHEGSVIFRKEIDLDEVTLNELVAEGVLARVQGEAVYVVENENSRLLALEYAKF